MAPDAARVVRRDTVVIDWRGDRRLVRRGTRSHRARRPRRPRSRSRSPRRKPGRSRSARRRSHEPRDLLHHRLRRTHHRPHGPSSTTACAAAASSTAGCLGPGGTAPPGSPAGTHGTSAPDDLGPARPNKLRLGNGVRRRDRAGVGVEHPLRPIPRSQRAARQPPLVGGLPHPMTMPCQDRHPVLAGARMEVTCHGVHSLVEEAVIPRLAGTTPRSEGLTERRRRARIGRSGRPDWPVDSTSERVDRRHGRRA